MSKKVVFIAFAKEDEVTRNLFTGQRVHPKTPFEFTDMSVKEPYRADWKARVLARVRRSDGVIALISKHTPSATGQLWEIRCAREEGKSIIGVWISDNYRKKPVELGSARCIDWTWEAIAAFIDGL